MKTPATLTVPERRALCSTTLCLALLGGAGLFLGNANPVYQFPPLTLFFPACLAIFSRLMPTAKGSFYAGWLCAALGSSACMYWVSVPVHDYGLVPWPFAVPAALALGAYLGLYGGLFSWLYRVFRNRLPFPAALLLVCPLWASVDIAREHLFTGFPWLTLATAFVPWTEWAGAAALVGSNLLSGLFALAAVAIAEARPVQLSLGFLPLPRPKKRRRLCLTLAVSVLALVYASSFVPGLPEGREVPVGIVQGNVDQNQKWDPAYQAGTLSRYLSLSEWTVDPSLGKLQTPVELVVWPETSMPFFVETNPALVDKLLSFTTRFSVPLLFGAPGKSDRDDGSGYYNRMWLFTADLFERQRYDKAHLVPFGEYVPFSISLPFLEHILQGMDFIPGTSGTPLKTGDLALGGLICYEAIFPDLAAARVADGANLLVNISNDAWFGKTSAPAQHLHQTAMRAIEQGRYIVRATNTGISAIITPRGRIPVQGSLFKPEALAGTVRLVSGFTVYHKIAPYLFWGCLLVSLAALLWCFTRRGRNGDGTYPQ